MVTIEQGVWGDVWFWEGDFMPGCPTGTVEGVSRELRIHELASLDQVDQVGAFYEAVRTPLVAAVQSDELGFFEIELDPGTYSIFSVEDTLFYCSRGDGQGNLCPLVVREGEVTGIRFDIWYKATF